MAFTKFVRVTLTSPSGNVKTRFQFVWGCTVMPKVLGKLCQHAVDHGNEVKITYSAKEMVREKDEMDRVNHIMWSLGDVL